MCLKGVNTIHTHSLVCISDVHAHTRDRFIIYQIELWFGFYGSVVLVGLTRKGIQKRVQACSGSKTLTRRLHKEKNAGTLITREQDKLAGQEGKVRVFILTGV